MGKLKEREATTLLEKIKSLISFFLKHIKPILNSLLEIQTFEKSRQFCPNSKFVILDDLPLNIKNPY